MITWDDTLEGLFGFGLVELKGIRGQKLREKLHQVLCFGNGPASKGADISYQRLLHVKSFVEQWFMNHGPCSDEKNAPRLFVFSLVSASRHGVMLGAATDLSISAELHRLRGTQIMRNQEKIQFKVDILSLPSMRHEGFDSSWYPERCQVFKRKRGFRTWIVNDCSTQKVHNLGFSSYMIYIHVFLDLRSDIMLNGFHNANTALASFESHATECCWKQSTCWRPAGAEL